ncbi:hypothetical protein DM39_4928 [Burkholderia cenocepacia]|uniref:EthD domain-containing protein n=1 Tax=Burkholderia cenocepacia TaxID=95486 RepID=A0AAN0VPZ0_9BURK|nr:hypothetical protein DM39_4928 [Burkholderia cenocepacia]
MNVSTVVVPIWMRKDKSRDLCFRYWLEPHGQLVARNGGLHEYRQHHVMSDSPSLWSECIGVSTRWDREWLPDGAPEVAFTTDGPVTDVNVDTRELILDDEQNVFERSFLYQEEQSGSVWHKSSDHESDDARFITFISKSPACDSLDLSSFVHEVVGKRLAGDPRLNEVRTTTFRPYAESRTLWPAPNVCHDHPESQQFHAMVIMSAKTERDVIDAVGDAGRSFGRDTERYCSALRSVRVKTYLMVKDGILTERALRGETIARICEEMHAASQSSLAVRTLFQP